MNIFSVEELIREFRVLMVASSDDRTDLQRIMKFLSVVQTFRSSIPPTAELVTVIKHRKPVLFGYLRKSISPSSRLNFILQLDMDYNAALERLGLADDPYFRPRDEA